MKLTEFIKLESQNFKSTEETQAELVSLMNGLDSVHYDDCMGMRRPCAIWPAHFRLGHPRPLHGVR